MCTQMMSSACSHPAYPAWPPWQLGTLFLESSQLNLTTASVEQLWLWGKRTRYWKPWHIPQKYHPPFENNTIKIRILLPQFLHTFSFPAFPAKLHPQMHSCLVLCCVSLSPRHPLLSQAHSSPARWGNLFLQWQQSLRALVDEATHDSLPQLFQEMLEAGHWAQLRFPNTGKSQRAVVMFGWPNMSHFQA